MSTRPIDVVRERKVHGASAADLLAVGLAREPEATELILPECRRLLAKYGSMHRLGDLQPDDLRQAAGLENYEIERVMALLELGRRIATADRGTAKDMDVVANVMAELKYLQQEKAEHFVVLLLDTQLNLIRRQTVHIGTLNQSLVGAREVFREAIQAGAASIILAHNHPSGDPTPSPEDREITRCLSDAGNIVGISVVDHVVVGNPQFFFFSNGKYYG
jgi:DNA repair protein RadC